MSFEPFPGLQNITGLTSYSSAASCKECALHDLILNNIILIVMLSILNYPAKSVHYIA